MKLPFYLFTIGLGIILTVHLSMNGKVGLALENPRVANAVFWCIGAAWALIIGLTGWQPGALNGLRQINPVLLTAGVLGSSLVFAIAWMVPKVGASFFFISLMTGQILGGMILSHFGWLGSPVQPVTARNVIGALVMIGGVVLATSGK